MRWHQYRNTPGTSISKMKRWNANFSLQSFLCTLTKCCQCCNPTAAFWQTKQQSPITIHFITFPSAPAGHISEKNSPHNSNDGATEKLDEPSCFWWSFCMAKPRPKKTSKMQFANKHIRICQTSIDKTRLKSYNLSMIIMSANTNNMQRIQYKTKWKQKYFTQYNQYKNQFKIHKEKIVKPKLLI